MDDNPKALALELLSLLCDLEGLCLHCYARITAKALCSNIQNEAQDGIRTNAAACTLT